METAVLKRRRPDSTQEETMPADSSPSLVNPTQQPLHGEGINDEPTETANVMTDSPAATSSGKVGYKKKPAPRKNSTSNQKKNGQVMKGVAASSATKVFAFNVSKDVPKAVRDSVPLIPPELPDTTTTSETICDSAHRQQPTVEQAFLVDEGLRIMKSSTTGRGRPVQPIQFQPLGVLLINLGGRELFFGS